MKFDPHSTVARLLSVLAVATISACGGSSGNGADEPVAAATLSCDDSIRTGFKPDGQTSVISVKSYKKGDSLPKPTMDGTATVASDLCLVKLLVGPGNPGPADAPSTSPGIGIEVWLPAKSAWNGRVHALGGGVWAGTAEADPDQLGSSAAADGRSAPAIAAAEGAVTSSTDTGHSSPFGGIDGSFAMNPDGTPNTVLWTDFASRGVYQQVVKTKALAAAYYGSAPKRTYWDGGSTGGRQGLKLAQMYPEEFDGIISGYPAINWARFITGELYPQIVIQRDLGGNYMSPDQLALVSNAATAACDVVGGVHLGYILDPAACRYDPTKDADVLCTASGGKNSSAACVSTQQATAINKIWYGITADGSVPDPAIDNGWAASPSGAQRWYGLARGTDLSLLAGPMVFPMGTSQVALQLQDPTLAGPPFRNAKGNGADGWKNLTYAQLSDAFDKGVAMQSTFGGIDTDNPDLSAFKARGGKLIQYHGSADQLIYPQGSIHYYNRVAQAMGGLAAVQGFYRFYMVPGHGHGSPNGTANPDANPPAPAPNQVYTLLTDWVENGKAPETIVMQSAGPGTPKSQPICLYPKKVTYQSGDPLVAASYTCS